MLTEMQLIERELMTTPAGNVAVVIAKVPVALKVAEQIEEGSESQMLISSAVADLQRLAAQGAPISV